MRRRKSSDHDADDHYEQQPRRKPRRRSGPSTLLIVLLIGAGGIVASGCGCFGVVAYWLGSPYHDPFPEQTEDYAEARKHFRTTLIRRGPAPADFIWDDEPPPGAEVVTYNSGGLVLEAWTDEASNGVARKPAVLWLHASFSVDESDWVQTKPYRDAGFVVFIPILRGENGQAGSYSAFYDEVGDALAAAEVLAGRPGVDPNRLYVAGYSTGSVKTMLVAMTTNRFRAAAAISGVPDFRTWCGPQPEIIPFDLSDKRESIMRSPLAFPKSFKCPTRLYYGDNEWRVMKRENRELAKRAAAAGLDVQAVELPGDHGTVATPAIPESIRFFKSR